MEINLWWEWAGIGMVIGEGVFYVWEWYNWTGPAWVRLQNGVFLGPDCGWVYDVWVLA